MQPITNTLLDPVVNFGKVTVIGGHTDSIYDTEVTLVTGDGSKLPNPVDDGSFNLVWFDSSTYYDPADDPKVEIVRCIARVENTLTLMRGQEGTLASTKNTPGKTYKMVLAPTKKTIDDIEIESQLKVDAHSALSTGVHGISTSGFEDKANKNVVNGYAGLDANAQISPLVLPPGLGLDLPSGLIMLYAGDTAPTGWLLCNGTAVSRTTYEALFAIIGTTFGVGDGSTTFNVPDTRDRFVQGVGTSNILATTGGAISKTSTGGPATGRRPNDSWGNPWHNLEGHTHDITDIRPPYLTLNHIIKI